MNNCVECGYKIEGEFKFCPNCGSQLILDGTDLESRAKRIDNVFICKNCGEENSTESLTCFSCGMPLKSGKEIKQAQLNYEKKQNRQKEIHTTDSSMRSKIKANEKVIDNKKILLISSFVIIVFVFALIVTGVFNPEIQHSATQMNNESKGTGVDLSVMNEINDLENKIRANPNDFESTLHLAHLLQDSRFFEKAISNYKKYLAKYPDNSDARVDMGICFYNLGDYTNAISEMETALKYDPKHQIAHLNLGIVNLTAGNIEVSKEWFKKAVELNPDSEAGKKAQQLLTSH